MKASDFAPFFGMHVLLQFKETIALAEASGPSVPTFIFGPHGIPVDADGKELEASDDLKKRAAKRRTWPLQAARASQGENVPVFTFLLEEAIVMPVPGGSTERVIVSYIRGSSQIELCIDPEHILCCSVVRDSVDDAPAEPSIIAKA
jgi:hypothetical protein